MDSWNLSYPPPQEVFLEDLDCICGHASAMGNIISLKQHPWFRRFCLQKLYKNPESCPHGHHLRAGVVLGAGECRASYPPRDGGLPLRRGHEDTGLQENGDAL